MLRPAQKPLSGTIDCANTAGNIDSALELFNRVINSVLRGVLTYDGNLVILEPPKNRENLYA